MTANCVEYHINKENKLIGLGDGWDSFAVDNKASQIQADRVLNRSLFDFVNDSYCRHIYDMVISRVWQTQKPVNFPFRCDAPDRRRYMQMEVAYIDADSLCFRSCITREESRGPILLLDTEIPRTDEVVVICSWCKKIRVVDETWLEVEDGIAQLGLFNAGPQPGLSHGMCNACYENTSEELT